VFSKETLTISEPPKEPNCTFAPGKIAGLEVGAVEEAEEEGAAREEDVPERGADEGAAYVFAPREVQSHEGHSREAQILADILGEEEGLATAVAAAGSGLWARQSAPP